MMDRLWTLTMHTMLTMKLIPRIGLHMKAHLYMGNMTNSVTLSCRRTNMTFGNSDHTGSQSLKKDPTIGADGFPQNEGAKPARVLLDISANETSFGEPN